ncbi:hypothetical protein ZIOFF_021486 [Zingiber officinale]|uniref:Pentatricopeptide repeat-containing protein n=1 Tax=Zingiber officinale TaxID=94328 RepID=A0A8J5H6X7_ZINOF|nr:hypothetical protein ZIOFF_021486 [Zingiber officinale]
MPTRSTPSSSRPNLLPSPLLHAQLRPVIPACAATGADCFGRQVHALVLRHGAAAAVYVAGDLTDMYAKCGRVEDFRKVFDEMAVRSLVSWNALIVELVRNKLYCDAMDAFR